MVIVVHLDDNRLELVHAQLALKEPALGVPFDYRGVSTPQDLHNEVEKVSGPCCLILDVVLGQDQQGGIKVLREIRRRGIHHPVIILSNVTEPSLVALAIQNGAQDFISKGFDDSELPLRILKALGMFGHSGHFSEDPGPSSRFGGATMQKIFQMMPQIIRSHVNAVLVTGESGTGKELVAEALRRNLRPDQPFLAVNCAAIKEELLESELFGHRRGSFTGAINHHRGLFQSADGGWIFLDEVARLSLTAQAALLRVLEAGEVRAVGSDKVEHVNVRVMAATNERLEDMVGAGRFRSDLLQRLAGYSIKLPPLRHRRDEIADIIDSLMERLSSQSRQRGETVDYKLAPALKGLLAAQSWRQGNVRELWQTIQSLTVQADSGNLTLACLPDGLLQRLSKDSRETDPPFPDAETTAWRFPLSFYDIEDTLFLQAMREYQALYGQEGLTQRRIASNFGISRKALQGYLVRLHSSERLPKDFYRLMAKREGERGFDDSQNPNPVTHV